ncbi:MAG TPA: DMT family transporter [Gammaproteobacteria bacterium]|nr:DMT family transporter [Gammaproteobacteria bacterium]
MKQDTVPLRAKIIILIAVTLWASAFAGIRAGLEGYTPGALALLRFLVASVCIAILHARVSKKIPIAFRDKILLLLTGMLGLGIYSLALNYGEIQISSGVASFIISLSPLVTLIIAALFLNETVTGTMVVGTLVSIFGVGLIMASKEHAIHSRLGFFYLFISMVISGLYSIIQKPFLKKYHALDVTSYIIWGATLLLLVYTPEMINNIRTASMHATFAVIYLGIFPATAGFMAWSYALKEMPASRAVNYLYFMPIIATLTGWIWLGETPAFLSLLGGLIALLGVWIVSQRR